MDETQQGDVTVPQGRSVACLYTFKNSSFTLVSGRPGIQRAQSARGPTRKPVEATQTVPSSAPPLSALGAGGELDYVRAGLKPVMARGGD